MAERDGRAALARHALTLPPSRVHSQASRHPIGWPLAFGSSPKTGLCPLQRQPRWPCPQKWSEARPLGPETTGADGDRCERKVDRLPAAVVLAAGGLLLPSETLEGIMVLNPM